MWADPRFEIDVDSADYKQLHPNSGGSSKHPDAESEDLLEEHFEDVEYSDGDNDDGADDTNAEVRVGEQRHNRRRVYVYIYIEER